MKIAQEEIFGPVLATLSLTTWNRWRDWLTRMLRPGGCSLDHDVKQAHQPHARLRAGTVWVNTYGVMDAALPFGGYKQSGFGRELGMHAIDHYTELKSVWMNL